MNEQLNTRFDAIFGTKEKERWDIVAGLLVLLFRNVSRNTNKTIERINIRSKHGTKNTIKVPLHQ